MVFSGRRSPCTASQSPPFWTLVPVLLGFLPTCYLKNKRHKNLEFIDLAAWGFQSILRRSNPIEQPQRNIWFSSVYTLFKLHPTSVIFENLWGVLEIHLGWTPTRKRQECKETKSGSVVQCLIDSQSPCLNTALQSNGDFILVLETLCV